MRRADSTGGFRAIFHDEGWRGLYRGTSLALFGVSNGALQFMGYEKMKGWAFERKRRRVAKLGHAWTTDDEKLVCISAFPLRFCTLISKSVQYGVYGHVWRVETRRVVRDVPVPSYPLTYAGNVHPLLLCARTVMMDLCVCRLNRHSRARIIARSRRPSHIHGHMRASQGSIAASLRTSCVCSRGRVLRSSCMKILLGCLSALLLGARAVGSAFIDEG